MAEQIQVSLTSPEAVDLNITRPDQTIAVEIDGRGQKGDTGQEGTPVTPFRPIPFAIPGTTPSAGILEHLYMLDEKTVYVDYPENISNTGVDATDAAAHEAVIIAAYELLENGSQTDRGPLPTDWHADGVIHFPPGEFKVINQIDWPANVGIKGGTRQSRNGTTKFKAYAGGDLDDTKYVIRVSASLNGVSGTNWDSNFSQHFEDIRIDASGICKGLLWGGAQMSRLFNVFVFTPADNVEGIRIPYGTNGACIENVQVYGNGASNGTIGFYVEEYVWAAFRTVKPEYLQTGFKFVGQSQIVVDDCYLENILLPVEFVDIRGSYIFNNLAMNHNEAADADGNYTVIDMGSAAYTGQDEGTVIARGTIRRCDGPAVVKRCGSSHFLASGRGTASGNDHTPYEFSSLNMPPLTGVTATNPPAAELPAAALSASLIEVATVANAADSITIAYPKPGRSIRVVNNGANSVDVYPADTGTDPGKDLGDGVDTAVSIAAGAQAEFVSLNETAYIQT